MLQTGVVTAGREWEQAQQRSAFVDTINAEYRRPHEHPVTLEQVGRRLRTLFPSLEVRREATGARARCWVFPPLEHAREDFERYLGQPIQWDEEDDD